MASDLSAPVLQLRAIAEQLERGQAESPLGDAANLLLDGTDRTLTLVLVGLDDGARAAALELIIGEQHRTVTVKLQGAGHMADIRLCERGYSIEAPGMDRQEFDTAAAFVSALRHSGAAEDLTGPIRLALAAPVPLRNLQIVVIGEGADSSRMPDLLGIAISRVPVLMVAANNGHRVTPQQRALLLALNGLCAMAWPLSVPDLEPKGDWLEELGTSGLPTLPVTLLEPDNNFVPDFVVRGATHAIRTGLAELAHAVRAVSLFDMVLERYESEVRQLQARHKRQARTDRTLELEAKQSDIKKELDRAKAQFTDCLARLAQAIRDNNRRSLLKAGALSGKVEQLLASLKTADLDRHIAPKAIRLSLKPEVLQTFRRQLGRVLRAQLDEDCVLLRDGVEEARVELEAALAQAGAVTRGISVTAPDNHAVWEVLNDMLEIDINYQGELPRRGFVQRLGEGRRMVAVLLMSFSLFGSFAGFNIRQAAWAGIAFLLIFLGSVAYTYTSWRREEEESLDKEIDRVRENVAAMFQKVLADVLQEKHTRLQRVLDDTKRDSAARLDAIVRETQAANAAALELERKEVRHSLKLLEQRLKDLQPLGAQLNRVGSAIQEQLARARARLHATTAPVLARGSA